MKKKVFSSFESLAAVDQLTEKEQSSLVGGRQFIVVRKPPVDGGGGVANRPSTVTKL